MQNKNILIIGAGTMGQKIAEWFLIQKSTDSVSLYDVNQEQVRIAHQKISTSLLKNNSEEEAKLILSKLAILAQLKNLQHIDLAIEAVVENIIVKQNIFSSLCADAELKNEAVIASNTSSISITEMASVLPLDRQKNFLGLHFFNPATIMKLVEIIPGVATDKQVVEFQRNYFLDKQKISVISRDLPGFIVNRIARHYYGESLRILEYFNPMESLWKVKCIDKALEQIGGFKMGPFKLMDLIGIDVNWAVTNSVYQSFFHEPRYRPHAIQRDLVNAKRFGIKNGAGFYTYSGTNNKREENESNNDNAIQRESDPLAEFIILKSELDLVNNVDKLVGHQNLYIVDLLPYETEKKITWLKLISTKIGPMTSIISDLTFCHLPQVLNHPELPKVKAGISTIFISNKKCMECQSESISLSTLQSLSKKLSFDAVFITPLEFNMFIYPRVVSMIINEAYFAIQDHLASEDDIDQAMCNGVNYPTGPIQLSRQIGIHHIVKMLNTLNTHIPKPRYTLSSELKFQGEKYVSSRLC